MAVDDQSQPHKMVSARAAWPEGDTPTTAMPRQRHTQRTRSVSSGCVHASLQYPSRTTTAATRKHCVADTRSRDTVPPLVVSLTAMPVSYDHHSHTKTLCQRHSAGSGCVPHCNTRLVRPPQQHENTASQTHEAGTQCHLSPVIDGIYARGKAHMRSVPSPRGFPNVDSISFLVLYRAV